MSDTFIKIGLRKYNPVDYSVPNERIFRGAWVADDNEGIIDIDMTKARNIWRDKIRDARQPILEQLDVEYMRALESGNDTTAIINQKQVLRGATEVPEIEQAQTPEQLKAVQPIPNVTVK